MGVSNSDGPGKREDREGTGQLRADGQRELAGIHGAVPGADEGIPSTSSLPPKKKQKKKKEKKKKKKEKEKKKEKKNPPNLFQAARKKLESRRLAYDATLSKMQKAKKEDFRIEEELRAQRIKYEESSDDVYRRMSEIQESEAESMADLGTFLDAELEYYDRCRDVLQTLRRQWPAGGGQQANNRSRSRSFTAHSFGNGREESPPPPIPEPEPRPAIGSRVKTGDRAPPPPNGGFRLPNPDAERVKPSFHRTHTSPMSFEGPTTAERMSRARSDQGSHPPPPLPRNRPSAAESYASENETSSRYGSPYDRADSPARSVSRVISRQSSNNTLSNVYSANTARKQPPPPPPPPAARKKPPPPPPPKKVTPGPS